MRPIKFRAWDKKEKKMCGVLGINFLSGTMLIATDKNDLEFAAECELMQFTGFHDQQGKKIYEGDLIKVKIAGAPERDGVGLVSWSEEEGGWSCRTNGSFLLHTVTDIEVLGNIYENPYLLPDHLLSSVLDQNNK